MEQNLTIREDLKQEVDNAIVEARVIQVNDNATNQKATNYLKILKNFEAQIKAELRPHIEKAHSLHRGLVNQEKTLLAPIQASEQALKQTISAFLTEQRRIQAENQRIEREKAETAERKRREILEEQARKHEAAGRIEKAEERREAAEVVHVPVPIIQDHVEKQEGLCTLKNWKFKVTDEDIIPREYMSIDISAIGKVVRAIKDKGKVEKMIPGISVYSEMAIRVRT